MGVVARSSRLWFFAVLALVVPVSALAQCSTVESDTTGKIHLRCASGPEFKILPATAREPAAAKIRLPGPFDTAEFTAAYVRPGEVVRLVGTLRGGASSGQAVQELYAFLQGTKVLWIAVAKARDGSGSALDVVHNLEGAPRAERIRAPLGLAIPPYLTVVERQVQVVAPEEAYRRMGL